MRLIDADELYGKTAEWEAQALHMVEITMNDEDKTEWRKWSAILGERSAFKFDVVDAPTVDAEPVRHGRWLDSEAFKRPWFRHHIFECSVCRNTLDMDGVNAGRSDANYCPNCGARMDAE